MIRSFYAADLTDSGLERENNQDKCYQQVSSRSGQAPLGLLVVADGMGGHMAGEVASRLAVDTLVKILAPFFNPQIDPLKTRRLSDMSETRHLDETILTGQLREAILEANHAIYQYARRHQDTACDMGCTLTAALLQGSNGIVANVGDSRAYLLREGQMHQITKDHSLVASLVLAGQLEPEMVYTHPMRNRIYRFLGMRVDTEIGFYPLALQSNDLLVLCSDGLWEMVRNPEIIARVQAASSPALACRDLVAAANAHGGEDNISVVILQAE